MLDVYLVLVQEPEGEGDDSKDKKVPRDHVVATHYCGRSVVKTRGGQ